MTQELPDSEVATSASSSAPDTPAAPQDAAEEPRLLHITHAQQDEAWVRGAILPALGLQEGQYWTRAEDAPGAPRLLELERAVRSCRYTLLVASGAARVDEWTTFAGLIAQHLGIEEGKPRLLVVTRDFAPTSGEAHELLPLRQRALVCLDGSDPERLKAALAKLAAQLALTVTAAETPAECPYPGLRMFGAGDPASCFDRPELFFGRDEEANQLVAHVRARGRVLLVGPSGCGKSSLMRARVLPKLAEEMAIEIVRRDDDPDAALRAGLAKIAPRLGEVVERCVVAEDPAVALEAALAALPPLSEAAAEGAPRSLLLYVDQFEEVFRDDADSKGRRAAFFKRLALLGKVPHLAILLGMRADFYAHLMRSPAWDDFKDHRVELAPLRGAGLRHAIVRPAARAGVHVEADLVERLVREAELDRAAEALPLLQVALEQLWAQREWRYLSLASYAKLAHGEQRGLDAVLARHADASIAAMAEPRQVLARRVLIDLVHLGEGRPDTRRRRSTGELRRAGDDEGVLTQVLLHLSRGRLIAMSTEVATAVAMQVVELVSAGNGGSDDDRAEVVRLHHIDLAHDALITGWPSLAAWVTGRRDELRTQRRLEARAAGGGLLAASELPEFLRWVAWIDTPAGHWGLLRFCARSYVGALFLVSDGGEHWGWGLWQRRRSQSYSGCRP